MTLLLPRRSENSPISILQISGYTVSKGYLQDSLDTTSARHHGAAVKLIQIMVQHKFATND